MNTPIVPETGARCEHPGCEHPGCEHATCDAYGACPCATLPAGIVVPHNGAVIPLDNAPTVVSNRSPQQR